MEITGLRSPGCLSSHLAASQAWRLLGGCASACWQKGPEVDRVVGTIPFLPHYSAHVGGSGHLPPVGFSTSPG